MVEENENSVFSLLPKDCISHIVGFTSPKDACRASAVSWGFKDASESDIVWKNFLPPDRMEIISTSVTPLDFSTKKELFFGLFDSPVLLDGGTMSFSLSKLSGEKCYMLCARKLSITGGDNPVYWIWNSTPESRFSEVAELLAGCPLDIRGKMNTEILSRKTNYAAYLVFKIEDDSYGRNAELKTSVKFSDNRSNGDESDSVYFTPNTYRSEYLGGSRCRRVPFKRSHGRFPQRRIDGWMEIYLGEFFNDHGDGEIDMQLCETRYHNWQRGLIIEGIEVRPRGDA